MPLCREGKISLIGYSIGVLVGWICYPGKLIINQFTDESFLTNIYTLVLLCFGLSFLLVRILFRNYDFSVAARSNFLGYVFSNACGIFLCADDRYKAFGIYGMFMAFFHYSEYLTLAISNPKAVTLDSFMLFHSVQYVAAAMVSWLEFFVETYFFPGFKSIKLFWIIGAIICFSGEFTRKLAMLTARKSFHHLVQYKHTDEHKLVTTGIYSLMRHPSYVGWFYWSIGTQVILANPICFIIYILASWSFFNQRIYEEEITLLNFFGHDYLNYQKSVKTGLPFIRGYEIQIDHVQDKDPTS